MKEIRTFNSYNNGNDSRMNIHFTDGTMMRRRISAQDAIRIAKEGRDCLAEMIEKYAETQPKQERVHLSPDEERFFELRNMRKLGILDAEQEAEYKALLHKTDL